MLVEELELVFVQSQDQLAEAMEWRSVMMESAGEKRTALVFEQLEQIEMWAETLLEQWNTAMKMMSVDSVLPQGDPAEVMVWRTVTLQSGVAVAEQKTALVVEQLEWELVMQTEVLEWWSAAVPIVEWRC